MRRIWKIGFVLMASASSLASCQNLPSTSEEKTIKIGYLPITHAAPLYYAHAHPEELGDNEHVELVRFGSWIDLMDALNTSRIDGASVLIELAMKAHEKGIDLKAVALGHKDGNAVVVGDDIQKTEDLVGKTVAIPHTLSSHNILLDDMLQASNLAYEAVNVVELPPPEMPAALSEGRISGYIVAEPFGALGVHLNTGHVLYQSEELWPDSLCCALVLRQDFLETHPERAQKFITNYAKGGLALEEHSHYDVHMDYLNIDEDVLELSLEWISYDDLMIEEQDYELLRRRMLELGLSEDPPTYEDFIDTSYLEGRN